MKIKTKLRFFEVINVNADNLVKEWVPTRDMVNKLKKEGYCATGKSETRIVEVEYNG